ncbi:hypothetical protein B0186_07785 [Canicola haemoglobinophilus]|uniref:Uncharacterized protein conserved in bacteria n=1 Tax=Canicola haemoglobinophilus TaxID=733 RepID=A0A1V4B095_9PAST|nr:ATP-binding protein [Canicola haemoglobinophilus]OOR99509.1 hypothetical protein B0186_07785 [Canicola haemoglobinophilus]STO59705.1 Uncharacterized protein conserved in bacteria [Canicola haemoglobinophilus]
MSAQKDLFGAEPNQIRLAELSVYNWGSFNGLHSARIDPQGTLITGDNGTGKSTFIDALMALLQPAGKAVFNVAAAQGDRSDRSLVSYMRGSFGTAHDGVGVKVRSKREKSVVTGIRALYRGDNGAEITLMAIFSLPQASQQLSDVKRIYLVAKKDLALKTVLEFFSDGSSRQLKQWFKNQPDIICCDDRYSDYAELYRKLLGMENKNAPALLSRALGLKKIDDLTKLIRELVLEPSNIRDEARNVVNEFQDLVAIHHRLLDARKQLNKLENLPILAQSIEKLSAEVDLLTAQKQALPIYFAEQKSVILKEKIAEIQQNLTALSLQLKQLTEQAQDSENAVEQRHAEYLQLGGERIDLLRNEIVQLKARLQFMAKQACEYQTICQQLQLDNALNEPLFLQHQSLSAEKIIEVKQHLIQNKEQYADLHGQRKHLEEQENALKAEWLELSKRPNSNIDLKYQQLRDELAQSLEFEAQDLMFIGELLDVNEQEYAWQGAIERAMGGKRTTLLVPEQRYREVTKWLNSRYTGLFVRLQAVDFAEDFANTPVHFKQNGFLTKLVWREHPYQHWLKGYLEKLDLICVNNVEQLNATPFSMTKEGLIHLKQGYFEKKDQRNINDRSQWQLGFNNQQKLALLETEQKQIAAALKQIIHDLEQVNNNENNLLQQQQNWQKLSEMQWEQIDVERYQNQLVENEKILAELENNKGDLYQAKLRWEQAKMALKEIQQQQTQLSAQYAKAEHEQQHWQQQLAGLQPLLQQELTENIRDLLAKRIGKVELENIHQQMNVEKSLEMLLDKVRKQQQQDERSAIGVMTSFQTTWPHLTVEWGAGLAGLVDYLAYIQILEKEGLPNLVEQFKQRLNKHTTQSLARLQNQFESEFERIRERISKINNVLQRTEFKQNSYLKLGYKREKYVQVVEFDQKVKQALNSINHDDHEKRFALLKDVVDILDKASNTSVHTLESQKLLDPRFQLSFYAEEIHQDSQEVLDVLGSSSAKSGGEKESFAGTILAASLAYVLTSEDADRPVYCTVFLDEAFSNTAESVSRRVLKVFKALHIHVNLITPFKNLNLAREAARSLLIAERDVAQHESRLCEITWQELDEQYAKRQALDKVAGDLGIEIEHG